MEHLEAQPQGDEKPLINIVGEKVALGPIHRGVVSLLNKWENDFAVGFLGGDRLQPVAKEATEAYNEYLLKGERRDQIFFIIYEYPALHPIGLAELRHIDHRSRTAEFGILIGEKDSWDKGYGTEATRLVLDYGFTVGCLHNIMLETYSYNERAIRAYTRAGFRIIGRRREAARWGNKLYDGVMMDCLSTEFETPLKRILTLP